MTILFRADSSSLIGTGHIMRDLVLAKKYVKKGHKVVFASRDLSGNINHKIQEAGYELVTLTSKSKKELLRLIKKMNIQLLVIDHYKIDYKKETYIKNESNVKILSFDDTYERHNCDILLNHNIGADKERYKKLVPQHCKVRCASKYTLLRDEFYKEKKKNYKKDKNIYKILLAMGGSDSRALNIQILKTLQKFSNIEVTVVTTRANRELEKLQDFTKSREWIRLEIDTKKIAKLMKKSDLAIITPSVTLNEVIFMQLPFIAIQTEKNQQELASYLQKNNYLVMHKYQTTLLQKYLTMLFTLKETKLTNFTKLSKKQSLKVLKWRNTEQVSQWMHYKKPITKEEHLTFVDSLKSAQKRHYFLLSHLKEDLGVIDFTQVTNQSAQIGLYTNPKLRGKGKILMYNIIKYGFKVLKLKILKAEVYAENSKAIKLYKMFNFQTIQKKNNLVYMELTDENR